MLIRYFTASGVGSKARSKGFSLLEMMVMVSIMSLVSLTFFTQSRWDAKKAAGQRLGTSFAPFAKALADYVQVNQQQLVLGQPVAGVAVPLSPTIAELRALNIFPTTFPLTIPSNGGTPIFRIAKIPTGCVGAACDLEYFAGNTVPELASDGTVNEDILSAGAAVVGATAGYSSNLVPGTIAGRGGWAYANPNGAVGGIFGIYTTYSQSANNVFVRIGDARDPALTGNLTVAGTVTAATVNAGPISGSILSVVGAATAGSLNLTDTVVEGAACSPNGAISKDGSGALQVCRSGLWRPMGFCTPYAGDLNTLQTTGCWNGFSLNNAPAGNPDWFFVEVMRHYNTANYFSIQRATAMTGSDVGNVWTRSQQSNVSGSGWSAWTKTVTSDAAGTVAITALQLDTQVTVGSACVTPVSSSTIRAVAAGGIATCENGQWKPVKLYASVGAACTVDGTQALSNVDGSTLICKNGFTMRMSDMLSNFVLMNTYRVIHGSVITKPACGQLGTGAGQPLAVLMGQVESSADAVFSRATFDTFSSGNPAWGIILADNKGNPLGEGLLKSYCYY